MDIIQILLNGIVLGSLYACIAIGFSLVWGVLNIINMLHGSFIILGGYLAFFAWQYSGVNPVFLLPIIATALFGLGYLLQYFFINKVVSSPVLTTLTLTFGLDMILYNLMTVFFTATPRRVTLDLGTVNLGDMYLPVDRLMGMGLALFLTALLFVVMRASKIGRAIVAVRMDRQAATLMGIRVNNVYAITFGIGAFMAGAAGVIFSMVFPITTNLTGTFLGKAFIICVIGGLGSVPGALIGGIALGLIESFAGYTIGPQNATTVGFVLMLFLLIVRPTGLVGVKGYE
ncbi:ABC transporter permease subunit [Sneathiella litorea]|uniref:Branched-chain amino acid ABC transporter permease n=1 Tax=Sneathiella litorea TaxID=2606216 RepID=A0A6L8W9U1_9PROT|nr:branched-chain amino acid ABC transporter permease [Sneathiella litorea]